MYVLSLSALLMSSTGTRLRSYTDITLWSLNVIHSYHKLVEKPLQGSHFHNIPSLKDHQCQGCQTTWKCSHLESKVSAIAKLTKRVKWKGIPYGKCMVFITAASVNSTECIGKKCEFVTLIFRFRHLKSRIKKKIR